MIILKIYLISHLGIVLNYKDCLLKAVNLGEDTDTIAAIAGGLARLYYGSAMKIYLKNGWRRYRKENM